MLFLEKDSMKYETLYVELLTHYTEVREFNDIQLVYLSKNHSKLLNQKILPKMLTKEDKELISLQEITRTILEDINLDKELIGSDQEETNNSNKFFELVLTHQDSLDKFLVILETQLKDVSFLNNSINLRVCDLSVFCFVFKKMLELDNNDKKTLPNVYRWFNYIQKMRGVREYLESKDLPLMEEIQWGLSQVKKKKKKKNK